VPRNLFMDRGDPEEEPEETPQGEPSPQPEIPEENLGGLFEDTQIVEDLKQSDEEWFSTLRNTALERRREPSRWERG
jgi:hypothetical protein